LPPQQGTVALPSGPGLGVLLDQNALKRFTNEKTQ
jgi:L-alanine-DL-glutamate epimerase-like enolase superfamily enzyme